MSKQLQSPTLHLRYSRPSPFLIGCRLHQDALRAVVKNDIVSAEVASVAAGVRRGQTAGLWGRAGRQGLVGPRDVGAGRSQRTLTDCLVDVLDRLENTLAMDSAQSQTQHDSVYLLPFKHSPLKHLEKKLHPYFCSSQSGSSRLNSFLIVPSISAARESCKTQTREGTDDYLAHTRSHTPTASPWGTVPGDGSVGGFQLRCFCSSGSSAPPGLHAAFLYTPSISPPAPGAVVLHFRVTVSLVSVWCHDNTKRNTVTRSQA